MGADVEVVCTDERQQEQQREHRGDHEERSAPLDDGLRRGPHAPEHAGLAQVDDQEHAAQRHAGKRHEHGEREDLGMPRNHEAVEDGGQEQNAARQTAQEQVEGDGRLPVMMLHYALPPKSGM